MSDDRKKLSAYALGPGRWYVEDRRRPAKWFKRRLSKQARAALKKRTAREDLPCT